MRIVKELEQATKDYREIVTLGMQAAVREAMRTRIQTVRENADKTRAEFENHKRTHGC